MGIKVTHNEVAHLNCFNRTSSAFTKRWIPKQTVRKGLDAKRYVLDPMFISHFRLRIPLPIRGFIFLKLNLRHPVLRSYTKNKDNIKWHINSSECLLYLALSER